MGKKVFLCHYRRTLLLLILITNTLFSSPLLASETKKILVIGDSISAAYNIPRELGWVNLLQNKITQQKLPYQVINASITGDTTSGGVARLPSLLTAHQPAIVIIELGGNDGLRGLSLKQMKNNLAKMTDMSQQNGARVLLAGMKIPPNYGRRYTEAFYSSFEKIADAKKTHLVPFLLEGIGGIAEYMQDDGIHPNEQAQPRLLENVWKILKPLL